MGDVDSTSTRVCTVCRIEMPAAAEYFHAYKRAKDGRRAVCKKCRSADHAANRDERAIKKQRHYQENKARICENARAYYAENADAQRKLALARHYKHRDQRLVQMRAYRSINIETLNERKRIKSKESFKARYKVDLAFTLKHRVRSLLRVTLKHGREGRRMAELLGYSLEELKVHLERQFVGGMTWERFMAGEIHIDHIVPASSFRIKEVGDAEFRACWSLGNLRPLWASENYAKQDRIDSLL